MPSSPTQKSTGDGAGKYSSVPKDDVVELRKDLANKPDAEGWAGSAPPILCYCLASILMTVTNKFVLSGANFNMNFAFLAIQSITGVSCVVLAKKLGLINFRDFDKQDAKTWFPISFALVLVIYTGSKSLQYLSIPVYTIFKNLTIILIAYGEVLWFGGRVTALTLASFGLMVMSSVVAAWSDITTAFQNSFPEYAASPVFQADPSQAHKNLANTGAGYLWMGFNCLTTATYVLTMRKRIKSTGFKDWDTMFYNNLLSIPVLVIFSLLFEEWNHKNLDINFPPPTRNLLLSLMAMSGAAAVFISYTTAWCVRVTSSTTYSMVGALNKLPVAASGMIFFGDPVNFSSVSAVTIGFVAGIVYAFAKNNQAKAEKKAGPGSAESLPMHRRA
ncbi:GDP-mannose transporter OS=Laccaria bicolor (strain S238N-H82 / ATCC MYA-4686) GN=VRG4 PE=3 SV=1 [Rhizoctonia solani AG-1 IB]|uniref:GDP-mannose transporter n=1 Tax=Thanatephorus cucumeris (strain AG1-IB / isolate 7/3/14) TaxID=1108050 RepID=A0A0B7FV27_THACB|nr:GDP-mannose transporter OS=Laccaria bicolor (strain S238N-H82 / ATCC MYA-4686) GN=VRG4 PE=3 SV=1 [Rhizoctonia solani AG-1 IB]